VHRTEFVDGVLSIVPQSLRTASSYEDIVSQGGGKTPGVKLSTRFKGDLGSMIWRVEKVSKTGGGTGMGAHDIYPDGHHVVASCVGLQVSGRDCRDRGATGGHTLEFFQSGCFNGLVPPSAVQLLNADEFPDVPGQYELRYVVARVPK
jgi:hypothetical protein